MGEFRFLEIAAGRVVGVDEEDGFGVCVELVLEGIEIEPPAFGILEGVVVDGYGFKFGEEFEEGVGRARDEDGVAGIAEEFEEPGVGFGRGGGE